MDSYEFHVDAMQDYQGLGKPTIYNRLSRLPVPKYIQIVYTFIQKKIT